MRQFLRSVSRYTVAVVTFVFNMIVRFGRWIIRQIGQHGPGAMRATGRGLLATLEWAVIRIYRGIRHIVREIAHASYRMSFGNWRRTIATMAIASLVLAKYYPQEVWPILAPLMQIAIVLFGIRVMLIPFWPMGRRRRR